MVDEKLLAGSGTQGLSAHAGCRCSPGSLGSAPPPHMCSPWVPRPVGELRFDKPRGMAQRNRSEMYIQQRFQARVGLYCYLTLLVSFCIPCLHERQRPWRRREGFFFFFFDLL